MSSGETIPQIPHMGLSVDRSFHGYALLLGPELPTPRSCVPSGREDIRTQGLFELLVSWPSALYTCRAGFHPSADLRLDTWNLAREVFGDELRKPRLRPPSNEPLNDRATDGGSRHEWPEGKRFAFSIVDDTDASTVENTKPVYDLLESCGIRITKTVWPLGFTRKPHFGGGTLEDPDYCAWVLDLQAAGFEIALHGATDHPSTREETRRALDYFREVLGHDPRLHANHFGQTEGMYWGEARLNGLPRLVYRTANAVLRRGTRYFGHVEGSPYFWGDLCRERIEYVRNFTFPGVNTLKADPLMPYHDPRRPYVQFWFSSSQAPGVESFCALLRDEEQDRLVEEGGACIAYTHFGFGFAEDGRLNPRFARVVERLAGLPGWFVPASTLLDQLRGQPNWQPEPGIGRLRALERRWLGSKLLRGRG